MKCTVICMSVVKSPHSVERTMSCGSHCVNRPGSVLGVHGNVRLDLNMAYITLQNKI